MSAKTTTIGDILRAEFSQIDDNIYQYIEGKSFFCFILLFKVDVLGNFDIGSLVTSTVPACSFNVLILVTYVLEISYF